VNLPRAELRDDRQQPPHAYDEILESIETVWDDLRAPKTLSWLTDVVALLIAYPCPSTRHRAALVRTALNDALSFREVDPGDVEVLRVIAADPALENQFATEIAGLEPERTLDDGPKEPKARQCLTQGH
jgi:hypothetical protein